MNSNEPTLPEESLFLQAIEIDSPDERAAFLDRACGADAVLRNDVEALLRHHRKGTKFLETPPTEVVVAAEQLATGEAERPALDFLSPSNDPHSLGRLGYYEILEVLGYGGFGVVLKARDTKLDRIVAVKTLSQSLATSATARKRFVREAKAAAAVKHENVVGIYHVADDGQVPFLVMECVGGVSLETKLQQAGTLDLPAILRIGMQIASGLAAAHKQGLVHRDVKPGNILLENGVERVKITDFGLARAADDAAITRTGEVAGTPQYMSPEQAQGLSLDARSDLFSLGSVLYAMGTGRSPFRAESTIAALRRVCDDTPRPIREINADIPDFLADIINRLLAKQPSERYQTATEVADVLGLHLAEVQQSAIVSTPKPTIVSRRHPSAIGARWWPVALIALVAIACIMGLTEASGVTKVVPTVIRIVRGEGTLVIEVDDPTVQLSLDGEALSIRGAGLQELRLLPGKYRLHATKDGQPVKDEVVTISREGREVVKVTLESSGRVGLSSIAGLPISEGMRLALASEVAWSNEKINALVEVNPNDPSSLLKRCHWHAVRFRWREARADLERVVAMQPDELELRADLAAICIFLEEGEAYATHCDVLHRRLAVEPRPWKVYTAARSLLLTDSAKFDFPMVRNEVSRRMKPDESKTQKRFVPISHYRCGDWQACVDEAEKLSPQGPNSMWESLHWVYRAMALYRLDRVDEAKSSLAAVKRIAEGERGPYRTAKPGSFQNFYFDGIHVQVVYREASALVLGQRQELNLAPITFPKAQAEVVVLQGQAGLSSVPAAEQTPAELKLLAKVGGHTDVVRAVAFLPDGRMISVGRDPMVRIWDRETREVVSTLPLEGYIWNADVSANGRLVAAVANVGDRKGFAQVWDLETRERVWELAQNFKKTNCLRFSPDGTRLVTTGAPPSGVLWDLSTGKEMFRLDMANTWECGAAAFSPDGRLVALGAVGLVRLFDVESGNLVGDVRLASNRFTGSLDFAPNGKVLASGQNDGRISLIEVDTAQVLKSLKDSEAGIHCLQFVDNESLFAASSDEKLRIWNIHRGTVVATVATDEGTNFTASISLDGQQVVTAGGQIWDREKNYFRANDDYALRLWQLPESVWPKKAISASPTKEAPIVNSKAGPPVEKPVRELTLLKKLHGHTDIVHAVSFLLAGKRMVSVDQRSVLRTWDLETRSVLSTLALKGGYCSVAEVSADGRFVATITGSAERTSLIRVWDLQNGKQICEAVQQDVDWLNCIRFTPDGTHFLTSGKPHVGVLWNTATGKEVQRFEVNDSHSTGAAQFSPDGRLLAMEGNKRVRLFDVESGELQGDVQLPLRASAIISLAFTPSGDLLACGHMEGRTDVIDMTSRQLTASLTNEKSRSHVVGMRFLDSKRLLLSRYHGELEVWDVAGEKIVATAASESGTTKRLALSPNGRHALAAHGEGWDDISRSRTPNGDYALRLWQLPESVWTTQETSASSTVERTTVSREPVTSRVRDQELKTKPTQTDP